MLDYGIRFSIVARMSLDNTRSGLALEPIILLMDTGAPFLEGKVAVQQGSPYIPFSTEHKEA
jgi:hypothetical protein